MNLNNLTKDRINNGPVPFKELLHDSMFYPLYNDDGSPLKHCYRLFQGLDSINSFVCCAGFKPDLKLAGYDIWASRDIYPDDYIPGYWEKDRVYKKGMGCGRWIVYKRTPHKDNAHGPEKISLLFLRWESNLEIFNYLYDCYQIAPKIICFNTTPGKNELLKEFTDDKSAPLHPVIYNRSNAPEWLYLSYSAHGRQSETIQGVIRIKDYNEGILPIGLKSRTQLKNYGTLDCRTKIQDKYFALRSIKTPENYRRFAVLEASAEAGFMVYDITNCGIDVDDLSNYLMR